MTLKQKKVYDESRIFELVQKDSNGNIKKYDFEVTNQGKVSYFKFDN